MHEHREEQASNAVDNTSKGRVLFRGDATTSQRYLEDEECLITFASGPMLHVQLAIFKNRSTRHSRLYWDQACSQKHYFVGLSPYGNSQSVYYRLLACKP